MPNRNAGWFGKEAKKKKGNNYNELRSFTKGFHMGMNSGFKRLLNKQNDTVFKYVLGRATRP